MLAGNDIRTFHALRLLREAISENIRPILIWIGAGASSWCGYPRWDELADHVHSRFLKSEVQYNKLKAIELLKSKKYPEVFQLCRDVNRQRYFSLLADSLKPRSRTPVYLRFIDALQQISPLYIVTTNVDESLENSLNDITTVQKSNLERCIDLLQRKQSFVCKLHGSTSAVESVVFTVDDYNKLLADRHYLDLLRHIFTETIVLFIGYGLGDQYVLDLLLSSAELRNIFGTGPHFAVVPSTNTNLPDFIKPLHYLPDPHKDHRSAIQIVEEIKETRYAVLNERFAPEESRNPNNLRSAHLLSDVLPPGTWTSSGTATLGDGSLLITGDGLTTPELPFTESTAMHDLIVGLLSFDTVYAPLAAVQRTHNLIGSEIFWELVKTESLRFIDWPQREGVHYPDPNSPTGGRLSSFIFPEKSEREQLREQIRKHLQAVPGKEREAEQLFDLLEIKTEIISSKIEPKIPDLTRGILLRPSVRNLLGMSGGIVTTSLPRWMAYPTLRLANVVKIGAACQILGITSTKLEYGAARLAAPAFAASTGNEWADGMASYILTGRFDTNLGAYAMQDPRILIAVLRFRESQAGAAFRNEIFQQLSLRHGGDVVTSINAGLNTVIPSRTLQAARDQLAGLLISEGTVSSLPPAIWNNSGYADKALTLWKRTSASTLKKYCQEHGITTYDLCPCGSGEKLRFCCEESLGQN